MFMYMLDAFCVVITNVTSKNQRRTSNSEVILNISTAVIRYHIFIITARLQYCFYTTVQYKQEINIVTFRTQYGKMFCLFLLRLRK